MNTKTPEQIAEAHCNSPTWGCWSDKGHDFTKCWTFDMIRLVVDTNEIKWLEEEKMAVDAEREASLKDAEYVLFHSPHPNHSSADKAHMRAAENVRDRIRCRP